MDTDKKQMAGLSDIGFPSTNCERNTTQTHKDTMGNSSQRLLTGSLAENKGATKKSPESK